MSHKIDLAEVIAYLDKVTRASDEVYSNMDVVNSNIGKIDQMESFTGYTAKNIKDYLNNLHVTLVDSFQVLYVSMKENLQDHIDTFKSTVDSSDRAIVQSDYLNEVKMKINIEYQNVTSNDDSIKKTLDNISDIVYIYPPNVENVKSTYEAAEKTIDELDANLNTFTTKGKKHDNNTKELLQNINVVMNKANASTGESRFREYKYGSESEGMAALRNTVKYVAKGTSLIEAHVNDKAVQRQKNQRVNYPKDPGIKADGGKESIWSKAKKVGSKYTKNIKDM